MPVGGFTIALVVLASAASAGCSNDALVRASASPTASSTPSEATVTTAATTSPSPPSTAPPSTTPTTLAATSTSTGPSTGPSTTPSTDPSTTTTVAAVTEVPYPNLAMAVFGLARGNVAVSVSVHRQGVEPWGLAAGRRVDGGEVTSDTPFVTASVSKLVTALSIARLVERDELTADTPIPWSDLGLRIEPGWADVTVRELLDHTSGMPINRMSWLDDPGPCSVPLQAALLAPPTIARTTWRYSNGNYCALGLLVEFVSGVDLDEAAYELVFEPAGVVGPYLSVDGLRSDSAPSPRGVARLARLGGAGTWIASTDDLVTMLDGVTPADLEVLQWPGIIVDQYGWGHTGTLDGAKACAWVLEDGRTTVAAFVSGPRPATGGDVCDAVLPALARDLGIRSDEPVRSPL